MNSKVRRRFGDPRGKVIRQIWWEDREPRDWEKDHGRNKRRHHGKNQEDWSMSRIIREVERKNMATMSHSERKRKRLRKMQNLDHS